MDHPSEDEYELLDPLTPLEIESRWRHTQRKLAQVTKDFRAACDRETAAQAEYDRIFLSEHLRSLEEHPERSVAHHKAVAELAALEAKTELNCAVSDRRSFAIEAENLRNRSSGLQTAAKQAGGFVGGA